ncbi:hypothetical protein [Candidatus Tisiphia endosymbiont of Nemotelus uliginosus]|uniref:hypothetical protein n=1 Tax=Candidatus Tisiphia endosymbiont of Nemotelus uliginosus TaxID=3077926 RepID=UPI0035C9016C
MLKQLEKLQQEINRYDDRIVQNPKEHNQSQFTKKLLEMLSKSRRHRAVNKDHMR